MVENWYRRARTFILEQRRDELERSISRFPHSERYSSRRIRLAEIEKELNDLKEE